MKKVVEIINKLASTSGTNDKIAIIKNNADNELLKKVFLYTYDDSKMYGFSDKKLRKLVEEFKTPNKITWENGFDMLDILASSNINDSLRTNVLTFLSTCNEEERELWIRVLTKDLRCKISAKTINKAIPNLIFVWDVQQAYSRDKAKLKKDEWFALSLKLNGIRSTFFEGGFRSRQNKPMTGYQHIIDDIAKLEILTGMVIDGELIRNNKNKVSDNENFRLTTSIVNSDADKKSDIQLCVFDLLPTEEFKQGQSKKTFKERLEDLNTLKAKIEELGIKNLTVAPTFYTGTDQSKIQELLDKVDGEGYEGLMLLRDVPYKCKRHNGILKCKNFKASDCKIVGFEEGEKDFQGKLGSFIIDYKGSQVGVGSGYTIEQREEFWKNKEQYIGRVLEVKFKEESMDSKTKLISLQFPTFICIREEGKEVSYN